MLRIITHATGSTGNAYTIQDGDQKILVDPGIRFKSLQKDTGFSLAMYDFCLLSHEHKDHSLAVDKILSLGIACAMSQGTMDALSLSHPAVRVIASKREFKRSGWRVLPFDTQHDSIEPLGFLILTPSNKKILYATDTYHIEYNFKNITHYIVECNHSENLLGSNEKLHEDLRARIRLNHWSIERLSDFFEKQDLESTEEIHLIHMSSENADSKLFYETIKNLTKKNVF